jgi:hypothetical protein
MSGRGGRISGPSRGKAVAAVAVFVAALLAGAGATLLDSVPDLSYAARWAGTPGLFIVRSCSEVGVLKERHTQCDGTFRSDDGKTVDLDATISQSLTAGAAVPVQRTSNNSYVRVGVAAFCGWLTVTLFGTVLAGTAIMSVLTLTGLTRSPAVWKGQRAPAARAV